MPASIKRNATDGTDEGARVVPGITDGKSYPVQGFTGGGAIVINDDGKFLHVGFADIDAGWSVTDDAAKKAAAKEDTKPAETTSNAS